MWETSGRLLKLLSLLQARREWAGTELADRLEVTTRTVRRDIERLRELGYPVEATAGTAGYRLGAGAELPPLLLDDEEAVAVALGLATAASGSVAGMEETSVRALAKLQQVLPSRLRHRVATLQAATLSLTSGAAPVDPDVLTAVATACRDNQQLRFDYASHNGSESLRRVEPYKLVYSGRRWYLVAYDLDRDDWRTFRVDRLKPRIPTGPRFTPREPPEGGMAGYTSQSVAVSAYRYEGRFTIEASAEAVRDRIPPTVGKVVPIDDGRCTLTAGSNSLDELALYVGLLGHDFQVHAPAELVEHLSTLADRLKHAST
ncbi:helix-turn-helix transcriptional regulator [Kribbella deserti]|uniref:Helix-turn-helix transcriptional regulator n=1 Tax=Kribbella deserti TaxID=1926257 RepID=A0ABV6QPW0_9ACTN